MILSLHPVSLITASSTVLVSNHILSHVFFRLQRILTLSHLELLSFLDVLNVLNQILEIEAIILLFIWLFFYPSPPIVLLVRVLISCVVYYKALTLFGYLILLAVFSPDT